MSHNALKARLISRRAELDAEIHDIEAALDAPQPTDWEDRSAERQGDEVLEAKGLNDLTEIRAIDAALARMDAGEYGFCLKCGAEIDPARLDAVPTAALCVSCA